MVPRSWTRRAVLSSVGAALAAGCSAPTGRRTASSPDDNSGEDGTPTGEGTPHENRTPTDDRWEAPTDRPAAEVDVNVLVENLEVPWDISVAPDGELFVSERVGRINRFTAGELEEVLAPEDAIDAEAVPPGSDEQPWWVEGGEGGTLGVSLHPDYPDDPSLYVYYSAAVEGGKVNRVSRFDVSADDPAATESVLIDDIPAHQVHNGGRLEFGPEGDLWVTTGTAAYDEDEESERAADPGSLAGKVLRVTPEGDPSPANPDLGSAADPRVFTYGHRNPQGIVWLPDWTPIVNEHGGTGHDEINRLAAGEFYGWPNSPRTAEKYDGNDGVHPPLANSGNQSWAPTGSVFYTADAVPSWSNRMVIGGLISQRILVATITPPGEDLPPVGSDGERFVADWYDDAYTVTAHSVMEGELGRVRHLEQGPNGELYAITSNRDGRARDGFPRDRDDVLVRLGG